MRHSLLALVVGLSVLAATPAAAQGPLPVSGAPRSALGDTLSNQPAPPDQTTFRTRRVASFLAVIPGGLLFVLYLYRQRPYLIAWTTAWILLALMLYGTSVGADMLREGRAGPGASIVGLARGAGISSALLLCVAIRAFRREWRIPQWFLPLVAISVLWLAVSARVIGLPATLAIIYVAMTASYCVGGVFYAHSAWTARMAGPAVIGIGMFGVAATYAYAITLVASGVEVVEPPNLTVFISVAWHGFIALGMHLMAFEDMSAELHAINNDLAQTQRDLQAAVVTDPLTDCYNRRFFDEVVGRELERQRRHGVPLSLVFIDCDNLKAINDGLGHSTGDDVLRLIAAVIRVQVRKSDYAFRWGGDEFLLLLSCDEEAAAAKAEAIQTAFASDPLTRRLPAGSGLSIGCVGVPPNTRDLIPLIREVDARMYANKRRSADTRAAQH